MVFAAQKLRRCCELKSPTALVLVDRDTPISQDFNGAEIANVVSTNSITELQDLLAKDTRNIMISTIFEHIIVLVDETHRTQEGDLGRQMRSALPNSRFKLS